MDSSQPEHVTHGSGSTDFFQSRGCFLFMRSQDLHGDTVSA